MRCRLCTAKHRKAAVTQYAVELLTNSYLFRIIIPNERYDMLACCSSAQSKDDAGRRMS